MRAALLSMIVGCATQPADVPIIRVIPAAHAATVAPVSPAHGLEAGADPCTLAAELPPDDLCSLICDPDALRQALIDQGRAAGVCYELACSLDDSTQVSVGVCLVSDH